MSRIGTKPITVPENVTIKIDGGVFVVTSAVNTLNVEIHPKVKVVVEGDKILVSRSANDKLSKSLHGLTRSLVKNAVEGVTTGFKKELEIKGVGYRAQVEPDKLVLKLGFSHDIEYKTPKGILFEVKKNIISISGIDKQLVGQVAAEIRSYRKPEPYKGKGIKYVDEKIIRKVGKAVKSTTAGA
jgi:large subunit ribosomal protein L6